MAKLVFDLTNLKWMKIFVCPIYSYTNAKKGNVIISMLQILWRLLDLSEKKACIWKAKLLYKYDGYF